MSRDRVIHIHPQAPAKPTYGASCNGCGVCCLFEACPLGTLLSLRREGPCRALQWSDTDGQYRCGAMGDTSRSRLDTWRAHLVKRWIAAGVGCDCTLDVGTAPTMAASAHANLPTP